MNARVWHLRKRDVVVLTLCAAFLISTLGAVGEGGRRRAKEVVCQSSLRQWNAVFRDYLVHNNGKFLSGCNTNGYWWPLQLPLEQQDWKRNRTWFCPTATMPVADERGVSATALTIFNSWGIFKPTPMTYQGQTYVAHPNGLCGSYGLNGYVLNIPETSRYEGARPAAYGWRDLTNVLMGDSVPMFIDAIRFDLLPLYTDQPSAFESATWSSNNQIGRCCINRHNGGVSCLFVDGSVRKVGLKELWTLKWHKSFHTAGPWTKAGGVWPQDWPQWMREFRDY